MRRVSAALAAAAVAGLGAIAATVWVGARVREETVVASPYEEGLGHDADRRARAALRLAAVLEEPLEPSAPPLRFALADGAGRPVEGAAVTVALSRPETSRGAVAAAARALGSGRFAADLAFPAPGPWDVRLDVALGDRRVRLERRVDVRPACDLGAGPCARPLEGGGEVVLALSPRPLRAMRELAVRVELRGETSAPAPAPIAAPTAVSVSFTMPGMEMGANRAALAPGPGGAWQGRAVLVRCPSGRGDWVARVDVSGPGAPRTARFPLTLAEGGR